LARDSAAPHDFDLPRARSVQRKAFVHRLPTLASVRPAFSVGRVRVVFTDSAFSVFCRGGIILLAGVGSVFAANKPSAPIALPAVTVEGDRCDALAAMSPKAMRCSAPLASP